MHHICDHDLVNPACCGTMPGHSSLDPVFVRELECEMCRLTRTPLVHFENDATSCCSRTPCFLANLASRKCGMDKRVCVWSKPEPFRTQNTACAQDWTFQQSVQSTPGNAPGSKLGRAVASHRCISLSSLAHCMICAAPRLMGVQPVPAPMGTCAPLCISWHSLMM